MKKETAKYIAVRIPATLFHRYKIALAPELGLAADSDLGAAEGTGPRVGKLREGRSFHLLVVDVSADGANVAHAASRRRGARRTQRAERNTVP